MLYIFFLIENDFHYQQSLTHAIFTVKQDVKEHTFQMFTDFSIKPAQLQLIRPKLKL
jgi:hypothetical protein